MIAEFNLKTDENFNLIKKISAETKSNTDLLIKNNRHDLSRFKLAERTSTAQTPTLTFAGAVRSSPLGNPNKRIRTENSEKNVQQPTVKKFDAPKPMMGTKTNVVGLSVVPKKTKLAVKPLKPSAPIFIEHYGHHVSTPL